MAGEILRAQASTSLGAIGSMVPIEGSPDLASIDELNQVVESPRHLRLRTRGAILTASLFGGGFMTGGDLSAGVFTGSGAAEGVKIEHIQAKGPVKSKQGPNYSLPIYTVARRSEKDQPDAKPDPQYHLVDATCSDPSMPDHHLDDKDIGNGQSYIDRSMMNVQAWLIPRLGKEFKLDTLKPQPGTPKAVSQPDITHVTLPEIMCGPLRFQYGNLWFAEELRDELPNLGLSDKSKIYVVYADLQGASCQFAFHPPEMPGNVAFTYVGYAGCASRQDIELDGNMILATGLPIEDPRIDKHTTLAPHKGGVNDNPNDILYIDVNAGPYNDFIKGPQGVRAVDVKDPNELVLDPEHDDYYNTLHNSSIVEDPPAAQQNLIVQFAASKPTGKVPKGLISIRPGKDCTLASSCVAPENVSSSIVTVQASLTKAEVKSGLKLIDFTGCNSIKILPGGNKICDIVMDGNQPAKRVLINTSKNTYKSTVHPKIKK